MFKTVQIPRISIQPTEVIFHVASWTSNGHFPIYNHLHTYIDSIGGFLISMHIEVSIYFGDFPATFDGTGVPQVPHPTRHQAATPASTSQQSPTRTRLAYLWPLRTQSLWSLSLLIWWSLCVWYLATPYIVKKIHPGMFEWYTPRDLDWWSKTFKVWCWNFGPHTFWAESPLLTDYKEEQHCTVYVPWFKYVRIKRIPATWYF